MLNGIKMKVFLTGGKYIGSHTCIKFLNND